jgi:N-acyl-D-amino-acid deacylase
MRRTSLGLALCLGLLVGPAAASARYDLLIRGGAIYDGSGKPGFVGDVAVRGARIVYVGPYAPGTAAKVVEAHGLAVAPGFVNMLSQAQESLLVDGKGESDLRQGVTLEVMGEGDSMGPETPAMARRDEARQGDIKYPITWSTLGGYLSMLETRGVSMNVASFVGATTVRDVVLGEADVQPTPAQLARMKALVRQAMEEGALGVGASLIYSPATYARTPELAALAAEAGRCGGIYIAHMRSEGDRVLEAIDETIDIARTSGAPAEIWHLKAAGRSNWNKLPAMIDKIEAARRGGVRISANMYTYTAGATGLDAGMPSWVQDGGLEAWIRRLKDPAIRARVVAEMKDVHPKGWENLMGHAGPDGTLLLAFKNPKLKPLTGKTLAEVARMRGKSPEETAIDLVIEDGSRVGVAYFLMSEDNVRRQVALPWVSFGSDEQAEAPRGVFKLSQPHPRAYGNFDRVLAKYVRDEHALGLPQAIRKLSALPAADLSLADRGRLKAGDFADVVVFDPRTIQDHATYPQPQQFSTGVRDVIVNGRFALQDGEPTGAATGRFVRGRAWTGRRGGGCRASAKAWSWAW